VRGLGSIFRKQPPALPLKSAALYLPFEASVAVAAAHHSNETGPCYEHEDAIALSNWRDPVELAQAVREALARFSRKDRDLSHSKKSEWPAFRASGCRSVKKFESSYQRIMIKALNHAELMYRASLEPPRAENLELAVLVNRHLSDAEFGSLILRLFDVSVQRSF
jgi:hypothetical protein